MTNERMEKLYNNMLDYLVELINDTSELVHVLRNCGFTDDEIRYELGWIEDEEFFKGE